MSKTERIVRDCVEDMVSIDQSDAEKIEDGIYGRADGSMEGASFHDVLLQPHDVPVRLNA